MSAEHDSPPSDGGEQYANIFIFDGQDYFHLARDQSSTIKGAYTALLENICFMLEEIYGANDQYCLVIPRGDIPAAYKDCSDLIYFENHDGKDSVAGDDIIERREAASVALSDFLYHLRLTAESLPKADNILIEKQSSTKFSIAAKDTRALAYALAILATQHGFHTGLYPVTRHGWRETSFLPISRAGFTVPMSSVISSLSCAPRT